MTRALAVVLVSLIFATGCSSDDEDPGLGAPPTYPVQGCEHIEHRPCDVRKPACQERLMTLAACLRGSEPIPVPPVTTMTTTEYVDYLNRRFAEDPPPVPHHFEIALTMLGITQPGSLSQESVVEDNVEFAWGFYRYAEEDVVIIDHGVPSDDPEPNSVLVHEFVHALQDADVDLGAYFEERATTHDSYLAAASVSEGEARLHQSRFWASLIGLDPGAVDWDEHLREVAKYGEAQVLEDPSPYTASFSYFPYELGARYVHHAFRANRLEGVETLFASPPARAVTVMASETELATEDWPALEFPELAAPAPWERWLETTLGAWETFVYLAELTTPDLAKTTALELRGDRLSIYTTADTISDTVVVWNLVFASDAGAYNVEALARSWPGSVARAANRVVLARATGGAPVDWALVP